MKRGDPMQLSFQVIETQKYYNNVEFLDVYNNENIEPSINNDPVASELLSNINT